LIFILLDGNPEDTKFCTEIWQVFSGFKLLLTLFIPAFTSRPVSLLTAKKVYFSLLYDSTLHIHIISINQNRTCTEFALKNIKFPFLIKQQSTKAYGEWKYSSTPS